MLPFISIGKLNIPMYGIMMAVGFLLSGGLSFIRAGKRGLDRLNLIIIVACILGGALVGGDLLYIFVTYSPAQIIEIIKAGNWNALGGIVFYGGVIGGVLGALLGSRIAGDDLRNYIDVIIPTVPLGHAFGRIGCFCAGCCYGRPTDSAIGVIYENAIGGAPAGVKLLPVQLFEAGADIMIFIILMIVSGRAKNRYLTACLYCIMYGAARFVLEYFRYDSIRGSAGGLSTSQWISLIIALGAIAFLTVYNIFKKKTAS